MTQVQRQYDQIAEEYTRADETIEGVYIVQPTFLRLCSRHIQGKSVVDLGCGSGISSRMLAMSGAKRVVGIDISDKEIEIARRKEKTSPLGIQYLTGDVAMFDFAQLEPFDVVSALFLLNYPSTREELQQMCANIFQALRENGMLFGIINNPDAILPTDPRYEVALSFDEGSSVKEGCRRKVTFYKEGVESFHFYNYLWYKVTYEEALRGAGFYDIQWSGPVVSREGMQRFTEDFWSEFLKNPNHAVLACRK